MEFNEEGLASPLRGKTLPQKIAKNADYKTVLAAALKKTTKLRQNLRAWTDTNRIRRYTHELEIHRA